MLSCPEGCYVLPVLLKRAQHVSLSPSREICGNKCVIRFPRVFASATLPPGPATPTAGLGARSCVGIPVAAVSGVAVAPVAESGFASAPAVPVAEDTPAHVEDEATGNVLTTLWAQYNKVLEEKPIRVKSITSFFGFMIGDICAQSISGGVYDPLRTARLTAFGVLMDGPVGHCWYTLLDKNVRPEDPKSAEAIVTKMALDQLIWAPVFSCVFFTFIRTLEGHPEAALSTIQNELVPTITANYALWPLAHIINFRFVPSQQRILYINFVQILWTCYLSNLAANGHTHMFHQ